jgi:predicted nuclease of restriction endonuclease-like (RecB) superfamily
MASGKSLDLSALAQAFPLPWSAYVRLLSVKNPQARAFYETEALRGGWTIAQLNRQIGSQFYERTALSTNKAAMLEKGEVAEPGDDITPEQAIKDHYALEGLPNKVLAAEYQTVLPDEKLLAEELDKTRRELEARRIARGGDEEGEA